jgi:hypothetical protein
MAPIDKALAHARLHRGEGDRKDAIGVGVEMDTARNGTRCRPLRCQKSLSVGGLLRAQGAPTDTVADRVALRVKPG